MNAKENITKKCPKLKEALTAQRIVGNVALREQEYEHSSLYPKKWCQGN